MNERKKLLLVDDEEDFCFFVGGNLENKGNFDVITATNGKDGLAIAKAEHPDLILLDLMMPKMSGEEVAAALLNDPETENIPVIFLTAVVSRAETGHDVLKEIAGRRFIAKPVNTGDLIEAIHHVLN
jgi:CheY-like chemotaxis protein